MNIENRMLLGDYYQDEQEKRPDEVNDLFAEWLEKDAGSDADYYQRFIEEWHPAMLLDFMNLNTMKYEFKKFKIEEMAKDFKKATGEQIDYDYVRKVA